MLNSGGGQPLDPATRAFMEPRFGHDFSQVRVHTDERAAESARAVNALAYTVGHQIVFGAGHYTPETARSKKLLAHELAHVVQQQASPVGLARKAAYGHSTEEKTSEYKPEANVHRGGSEMTIDEPNHVIKYRVYGFDKGSSDVGKLGIKEALDGLPYTLEGVNIRQLVITGLASESQLKGKGAYTYGLERAEAVQSYLAGKVAPSFVVTTKSEGSASAPPVSASPQQKAFARAVIIEIKYTGSLPDLVRLAGGHLELKPGPVDIGKIKQEAERKLTQQAREQEELPVFKQPSSTGYSYRYNHVIGRESETGGKFMSDTDFVLLALKLDPSAFFPFNVEGSGGEKSIVLGGKYDLVNKPGKFLPLPPGRHPIEVSEVTEHSFTFRTLPGHFDTPGSTITFIIYEDTNGNIHIEHDGVALPATDPSIKYLFAPDMAKLTWDEQAANLSKWLETAGQHQLIIPGK